MAAAPARAAATIAADTTRGGSGDALTAGAQCEPRRRRLERRGGNVGAVDVTSAVPGSGDIGLLVGGPVLDAASFSSREGADARNSSSPPTTTAASASPATLAVLPAGSFVLACERDTPDAQYVSASTLVVRHYADWAALVGAVFDREMNLPRTLAATAEGTRRWTWC